MGLLIIIDHKNKEALRTKSLIKVHLKLYTSELCFQHSESQLFVVSLSFCAERQDASLTIQCKTRPKARIPSEIEVVRTCKKFLATANEVVRR